MAERDAYLIPVGNTLVEVSKEVYGAYYRVERHTRMLDEKDVRNGTVQYSNLDTRERLGVDLMTDRLAEPVEEAAILRVQAEKLHRCLQQLPEEERKLIEALYFKGYTERAYAKEIGISQKGVNKRRRKILKKLRAMLKK